MANVVIREASEVQAVAETLIARHHEHLQEARILYLFTTQRRRKCDRARPASAAKLSAIMRYLSSGTEGSVEHGHDFLILVDVNEWSVLSEAQREALVDHELMHCALFEVVSKRGKVSHRWGIRGHDVEEFRAVIERHGLWRSDLEAFGRTARQLTLPTNGHVHPATGEVTSPISIN